MKAKKIYVSGALQSARDLAKARDMYERVGKICEAAGFQPYIPHANTDPEFAGHLLASDVHSSDLAQLQTSCAVVAYVGEPSLGVGAEVAIALSLAIPVIAVYQEQIAWSRFLRGLIESSSFGRILPFSDDAALESLLVEILEEVT